LIKQRDRETEKKRNTDDRIDRMSRIKMVHTDHADHADEKMRRKTVWGLCSSVNLFIC